MSTGMAGLHTSDDSSSQEGHQKKEEYTSGSAGPNEHDELEAQQNNGEAEGPPKSVHFFHPGLNKVRNEVFLLWLRTSEDTYCCYQLIKAKRDF